MPRPTDTPPASAHPRLAASIDPGPPPVMTAYPAVASARPTMTPNAYVGCPGCVRAEPKTLTAGPSSASAPKPSTNSLWIRSTRHGSVCTQSPEPRLSSSRWSVVVSGTIAPRSVTGPVTCSASSSWVSSALMRVTLGPVVPVRLLADAQTHAHTGGMSVTPAPHRGTVLVGRDVAGRALRVSAHPEHGRVVLSIWQGPQCLATIRLAEED